jgi:hypothetical protein
MRNAYRSLKAPSILAGLGRVAFARTSVLVGWRARAATEIQRIRERWCRSLPQNRFGNYSRDRLPPRDDPGETGYLGSQTDHVFERLTQVRMLIE